MIETIANIVLLALGLYLAIGIVFYAFFINKGVHKIDSDVKSAPLLMKLLIAPGTIALWPVLLKKSRKENKV